MTKVFLDTGFLLALELANDINHQAAREHWRKLSTSTIRLITTTYIFDETITFLNSRGHHGKAVQVGSVLLKSPSVHLIHVDEELFMEGWAMFQKYHDKQFSLTDCISFTVMQREGIDTAMAFDHHFTQAGYIRLP